MLLLVGVGEHHHPDELVEVDEAVAVEVGLLDHPVHLLVGELLAEADHDVAQLGLGDVAVVVLVEHPEGLPELLLGVGGVRVGVGLAGHERQELGELDGAVAVGVHVAHHVPQLLGRRGLAQGADDRGQLLRRDAAVAVLVEEGEGLPELAHLLRADRCCGTGAGHPATSSSMLARRWLWIGRCGWVGRRRNEAEGAI
uniref:Uncharacterized protein n=1 Tax=Triticum urartu TaxID=4572 RepID=A0A8R7QCM5_TRIUA